jgi:glycosyltransferase involved in cell wall biosynthesis
MALYGGAETLISHLARYLISKGVEVSILSASFKPRREYEGLDIITPQEDKQIGYKIRNGKTSDMIEIFKIVNILRSYASKLVRNFDVFNPHNFPAVWATPKGTPVVWMCNEVPDLWHRWDSGNAVYRLANVGKVFDRWVVNSEVDVAVVSDERNAEVFRRRYGWRPRIIPYGIEGEFFSRSPSKSEEEGIREKFGLSDDAFYVIHVGMVTPSKNQLETLQALHKLKREIPNIKAIFAGLREKGNYYTSLLDKFIAEKGLGAHVIFTGHVNKDELRVLYHISHVAVLPGRGQGSWLSPFEALSAGKPVIVSPELPCSTVIGREDIGLVSDNLCKGIHDIYIKYSDYLKKAVKGKEFVIKNFTWEKFCEKYLSTLYCV